MISCTGNGCSLPGSITYTDYYFSLTQNEILNYLADKGYILHLITNGFEKTQHSKLKYSGLDKYFKEVITSEGSNSLKPHKEIFEYAFKKTGASR